MVYIPLTPLKEETKIKNSLIPESYISLSNQPKEYTDALQTKIEQDISNISDFDENAQESDIKDIWDAFHLGARNILHKSKQFFLSALPEMVFKNYESGEGPLGIPYAEETRKKVNERNEGLRKSFKESYNKSDKQYKEWVDAHPELQPRKEWSERGVLENIKENPKIFRDPAYWGFIAAESAAFSVGVIGTTLVVGAITKNPVLAIGAGVAVATPLQTQDLFEDLVANGATEEQAAELSSWIGPVIASVEVAGDLPILKSLGGKVFSNILSRNIKREVSKQVIKDLTKRGLLKAGVITFTKIEVAETIEEVLQGAIQNATVKTVNENRSILKDIPETALRTLIATVPFALTGGGSAIRQEARVEDSKIEEPSIEEVSIEPKVDVEEKAKEVITIPKPKVKEVEVVEPTKEITITKELEPLVVEAKKFDTAEKFVEAQPTFFREGNIQEARDLISGRKQMLVDTAGESKLWSPKLDTALGQKRNKNGIIIKARGNNLAYRGDKLEGELSSITPQNIESILIHKDSPLRLSNGNLRPSWKKALEEEGFDTSKIKIPTEAGVTRNIKDYIEIPNKSQFTDFYNQVKIEKKKEIEKKKVSKVAKSIKAKAEEKGIVDAFKDLAEFTPVVIKEQTAKIQKIIDEDIEKAKRMAIGEQPLEEGIKGALLVKMVEDYAMDNKDGGLILALANSPLVAETSVAGQTLRLIAERIPDSATAKIKEVEKERKEVAKKKLKGKTVKQVKAEIKQDLKGKLEKDSKKISKFSWQALINEVTC